MMTEGRKGFSGSFGCGDSRQGHTHARNRSLVTTGGFAALGRCRATGVGREKSAARSTECALKYCLLLRGKKDSMQEGEGGCKVHRGVGWAVLAEKKVLAKAVQDRVPACGNTLLPRRGGLGHQQALDGTGIAPASPGSGGARLVFAEAKPGPTRGRGTEVPIGLAPSRSRPRCQSIQLPSQKYAPVRASA